MKKENIQEYKCNLPEWLLERFPIDYTIYVFLLSVALSIIFSPIGFILLIIGFLLLLC